ncbi:MAG: hypothetical protein F6K45_18130 [Kamptonema sp. SIO1D9]|nr:hypothetical protein [Kamptonema sp. SIO1D9]
MSEDNNLNHLNFSRKQKWEIVRTLLERDRIRNQAEKAFRTAYPNAPERMINTAVFHIYIDGIQAALDWLVDVELFLQNPKHTLSEGITFHLIYHLYNWLQFTAILSDTDEDLVEKINDVKAAIEDDDKDAALNILEELKNKFEGNLESPNFF